MDPFVAQHLRSELVFVLELSSASRTAVVVREGGILDVVPISDLVVEYSAPDWPIGIGSFSRVAKEAELAQ